MSLKLRLQGLSKYFGSRCTFENIIEDIESGQCLVVTGPNGSGKSTLLRVIAGLLIPSSGQVEISVDGHTLETEERQNVIGVVAPDLSLYDELTALENLQFFAKVRGVPAGEKWLVELLEKVGLEGRERDLLGSFSSGMKQRVKYAFALLHKPPLLLLDEPTSYLDTVGVEMVDSIIKEQKTTGVVVIATNDKRELAYGDKIIELGQ